MGSIRPLVTIAILGAVGVYLYTKINEGPVPHAEAANASNQSATGGPLTNMKGTSLAADSSAPAWPSTAAASIPPSSTTAPAPASANLALPPASTTASNSGGAKDNMPAVPAIPELPPLPTMHDPAPAAAQPNIQLPKDLPASTPIARSPDQPGTIPVGAKDANSPATPLTSSTDPGKASLPLADPKVSVTAPGAPTAPPSTSTQSPPANVSLGQGGSVGTTGTSAAPGSQTAAQNPLRPSTPASPPAADLTDRYAAATTTPASTPTTPASTAPPTTPIGVPEGGSFAASWPAIQAALDHHDLKLAHQLLSKWHGNESLSPTDTEKVETLLSQLAGTVIYSTEHELEPARVVKAGETLDSIAKECNVPAQLLAKINGIQSTDQPKPGQQLKVVRGPFSAVIDLRRSELTLMLDECYAGKFHVTAPQGAMLTDGQWLVDQKLPGSASTPAPSAYATAPDAAGRSIILRSAAAAAGAPATLVIASGPPIGFAANPPALRVSPQDAEELSDILSVGSRVVVRK